MLPALIHSPTVVDWDEIYDFQAGLTGLNGSVLTAYNGSSPWSGSPGAANPLAVRWGSPWAGTRAAVFTAQKGFLAADASPTGNPLGQGAFTLAFCVQPSSRYNLTGDYGAFSTLVRWGRNRHLSGGTAQLKDWIAWDSEDDSTTFEVSLGNSDSTAGYIGKQLWISHDSGNDPAWYVRTQRRDVHSSPQAGITHVMIARSGDVVPTWTVALNGRVFLRSTKQQWRYSYLVYTGDWALPTGSIEPNCRLLFGEAFNGALWTPAIIEREVTGLDVGEGNTVTGEAYAIYDSIPWEAAGLPKRA